METIEALQISTDNRGRGSFGSRFANQELEVAVQAEYDVEGLPAYFARHKTSLSTDGMAELMGDLRFGIHWVSGPITHEAPYESAGEGAKKDIRALKRISRSGALVCAVYEQVNERMGLDLVQLGIVPRGSEIMASLYEGDGGGAKKDIFIKGHQMRHVVQVAVDDAPELFEGRPRGSVRQWHSKSEEVRAAYREYSDW